MEPFKDSDSSTMKESTLESRNPAFRKNTFTFADTESGSMTMSGAINKAGFLFVLLMIGAVIGWNLESALVMLVGGVGGMIAAFTAIFKRTTAPYTAPVYAVLEGLFLGSISIVYDTAHPGIAANAMTLTFGILGVMLLCYRLGVLRATPAFTRTVVFATIGIACVYVVDMLMGFFGHGVPFIHDTGWLGIGVSLVISGIAAMNLILDFDVFERAAAGRAPKYMEWYCGFSLLVTLVWIYVEMLRLLSKLSRR
jgi:uncharacterized YccA/Bax inhibitor family protein